MTVFQDDLVGYADDYVLGLLSPSEAQLFEALIAADPALAAQVARLRDHLMPLDLSAEPVDLPADFVRTLHVRIAQTPQDGAPAIPTPGLTGDPTAAPVPSNLTAPPSRKLAGLAAALVLGIAMGLGGGVLRPAPEPQVVAVLLDEQGLPRAVIEDYGNDTARIQFVSDIEIPEGRTLQAWTLPSAEIGATSLGVLKGTRAALLDDGPDLPPPANAQLYEITLEPDGGSPTGRPTGPVIAKGLAAAQNI